MSKAVLIFKQDRKPVPTFLDSSDSVFGLEIYRRPGKTIGSDLPISIPGALANFAPNALTTQCVDTYII